MAEFNKEDIGKLPLRERIRRLKELEDDRKKEMDEIGDLLKDSERRLRNEEVAEEVAPEPEEVDISRLFGQEEEELERTVREDTQPAEEEAGEARYLSPQQALEDYEELRSIGYEAMEHGLNENQMEAMDKIGERLDRTKYTVASQEVANIVVASRAALYKIRKYAGLE